ncbi:MAG: phytoene dehydrogenase [Halobacteriovoraceae bacterium]|nr:phytoene dehydrogenase [Halobacteriovoraceae bacterium]
MLIRAKEKITKSYDIIIVGSGLAGMTAANKLGRNGRKVLLLESHNKLGGFATWFKRRDGDHIFDVSLHGFPVGMIKTCKRYWSREIANSIIQLKKVRFINPMYDLETEFTKEDFKRKLKDFFKIEEEKIEGFFSELESMNFYDPPKLNNGELFEKFFPGRKDVVRFLLEPITYANGSNLEDPAITYGIVFSNFMSKGVFTFKGGTDVLIGKMKDELLSNGVDIKMHAKVSNIVIEGGKVKGVKIGEDFIASKAVLSNSNVMSTIFKLVGEDHFSKDYIKASKKVRLNTSSCQVYMGIREGESIPDVGDLLFYSEDPEYKSDWILSPKVGSQTFSIYYPECRPHLNNRYAVVSSSNARYEDWKGLSDEEYLKQKKYIEDKALTAIEKLIPGISKKIDFVDSATPLTVEKYTLHDKGSSFGTKFEGLDISMNMHKEIDGLFHSGSVGIIMSGWLGAANYGVIQSHEVEAFLEKGMR